jgi:pimeloyl-ACP methyl ester carboxylesterase/acyl carrier protein
MPCTEFGLDSIIAVQWLKTVNAEFGTALKATDVYDFQTIRALGMCVAREVGPNSTSGTAPAEPAEGDVDVRREEAPRAVDDIELSLVASLSAALFIEPGEISSETPFTEVGLDSVIAVQWMKAINADFNASFPARIIHDYPTIGLLAGHLRAELANGAAGSSASPAASLAPAATDSRVGVPQAGGTGRIVDFLRQSLANALFMECEQIDGGTDVTEYGLDSIIAVQWIKAVNAEYGTNIRADVLYKHSTVSALAEHVFGHLATASPDRGGLADHGLSETDSPVSRSARAKPEVWAGDRDVGALSANLAYALAGCRDMQVTLVEVSPGCRIEMVAAGDGSPVVLLPPMGAAATAWMHQIRDLSRDYRVLVFHYPGHGNSFFDAYGMTFEFVATSVRKAIVQLGIKECLHLVGWSMGALISQAIAQQSPEWVKSLTLVSAPASVNLGDAVDFAVGSLDNLMKDFADNVPLGARGAPESDFNFVKAFPFSAHASSLYLHETLAFDYARAAEISVPTMVLFGSRDRVISPGHGTVLADMITGSRSHVQPGGGHYIPLQNHAWFNERLREFFRDVEGRTSPAVAGLERA